MRLWPKRSYRGGRRLDRKAVPATVPVASRLAPASGSWALPGLPEVGTNIRLGFTDGSECAVDPESGVGRSLVAVAAALIEPGAPEHTAEQHAFRRQAVAVPADA